MHRVDSPPGDDNKDTNPHGDRPNFMYAWGESTFTEPVISPCPRGTANAESGSPPQQVSPESSQTLPAESTADATKNAGPGDAACGHPGGGIELDETDD